MHTGATYNYPQSSSGEMAVNQNDERTEKLPGTKYDIIAGTCPNKGRYRLRRQASVNHPSLLCGGQRNWISRGKVSA